MHAETTTIESTLHKEVLSNEHRRWQTEPVTRKLREMFTEHEDKIISWLAENSVNPETDSEQIRRYAAQLKTTRQLKKYIYDTETFVIKSRLS
jgi:hypothetical protein